jgi:hypothetical protein
MMRFYVSDDVENDVRRCIGSWEHQHSISVTGRTETGVRRFDAVLLGQRKSVAHMPTAQRPKSDLWAELDAEGEAKVRERQDRVDG